MKTIKAEKINYREKTLLMILFQDKEKYTIAFAAPNQTKPSKVPASINFNTLSEARDMFNHWVLIKKQNNKSK